MFHEEKPTTVRLQKNRAERRQENMKHILPILTAALFGAATFVFAQTNTVKTDFENYSVNFSAYDNSNNEGQGLGGYYTIKMKGEGSLYITNFFNPALSTGLSGQSELLTNPLYGITHYGYIDSTGNKHEYAISDTRITEQFDGYTYTTYGQDPDNPNGAWKQLPIDVPRDGYFLGNFTDGQEIQVYLARKDAEGNVIAWTATNSPQETNDTAYVSRWGGRVDAADNSMGVGQLYFPGLNEKQINFGIVASTTRDIPGITDVTVGSPLPGGIQIALIAGLFGLGFWYVRRRKAIAA